MKELIKKEKQQQQDFLVMDKIRLFGASGHGKVIKETIESEGNKVIAFLDDKPKCNDLSGILVFRTDEMNSFSDEKIIVSVGDNAIRKKICKRLNTDFGKTIHSSAVISNSSSINDGTVVMAGAIINADTKIGKHCIINTNSVIEHDCVIEDYVHISPNATITGNTYIGEGTHVGAGAIIIPNLKIGKWGTIGAGAVIIKDVPDYAVVVGNPGKIIKYNKE